MSNKTHKTNINSIVMHDLLNTDTIHYKKSCLIQKFRQFFYVFLFYGFACLG